MKRLTAIFLITLLVPALLLSSCAQPKNPAPVNGKPPLTKKYAAEDLEYKELAITGGLPIIIAKIWPSNPPENDEINANLMFENISEKTIREIYFILSAFDADNLPIYSDRAKSDQIRLKFSMEMKPGKVARSTWGPIWPAGGQLMDIRLITARIVFNDNSSESFTSPDALNLMTMPQAFQTEEVPMFEKVN